MTLGVDEDPDGDTGVVGRSRNQTLFYRPPYV
jgi:hypothetical protein